MAVVLDTTLGGSVNDGTSATIAFNTSTAVAVGGFIVVGVSVADTRTLTNVSGGGLTWTTDNSGDNGFCNMYIASAPAPSGLAINTTLTANFSGTGSARTICGVSFTSVSARGAVDALNTFSPTAWTTDSVAIAAGSVLVAFTNSDGGTSTTVTAPSVEDFDGNAGAGTIGSALAHRIEASAGSYTVAGTWTASASGGVLGVEYTAAAAAATDTRTPFRGSLGIKRPQIYTMEQDKRNHLWLPRRPRLWLPGHELPAPA